MHLADGEPDASGFDQRNEDADNEVEILGGGVTGGRGQLNATAAEEAIKLTLLLHDHVGQWTVKDSDGNAQQQSGDFYDHMI